MNHYNYSVYFQVHNEFKTTCDELTVQKLLDSFITSKQTGKIKPGTQLIELQKSEKCI